jgi:hypothetical protein
MHALAYNFQRVETLSVIEILKLSVFSPNLNSDALCKTVMYPGVPCVSTGIKLKTVYTYNLALNRKKNNRLLNYDTFYHIC